jgi:hypothetical protein
LAQRVGAAVCARVETRQQPALSTGALQPLGSQRQSELIQRSGQQDVPAAEPECHLPVGVNADGCGPQRGDVGERFGVEQHHAAREPVEQFDGWVV